jgi:hypothetical protein
MELLPFLLAGLPAVCATFSDPGRAERQDRDDQFGLAACALFFMQSASFLSFQRPFEKGQGRSNWQTLFGIAKIPSDNYIRDMLDLADPALLRPCFERVEHLLAEPPLRQAFGRLGGRTLIAWDGTEYFCSQKLGCPHCLTRQRANGRIENYHTLLAATAVAPGHAKVVPLFPDFIAPQDGAEKQDCERNAVKRWHDRHGERLRPLRPVYLGDDLFACQPIVAMLEAAGDDFIFTCKESSHKALYDFIDGAEPERHQENPQGQDGRDPPLSLDRTRSGARRQGRGAGQLDRVRDFRPQRPCQIFHRLGDQPAGEQNQCRRNRRVRQGALEDREQGLQRDEKSRL